MVHRVYLPVPNQPSGTMRTTLLIALILAASALSAGAQDPLPTIEKKTENLDRKEGYFPLYWDEDAGKIWLEVPRVGEDFLYAVSLSAGLGSNDIGLDRNQLGPQRVVRFERIGRRLLLRAPNLRFRASTDSEAERRAVEDAFAGSVVWGFDIAARTDDRFLVDATAFVVRDAHNVIPRLSGSGQGTFKLDASRSAPNPDILKGFPRNTEMEAILTFTSDQPGRWVRDAASDPGAITLRVRHSFVRLPDPGFEPRAYDPRSGYFGGSYEDYSAPIGEDMTRRFITRHRLVKAHPDSVLSDPVEAIVYYLDPGTPEPVRSALLDGARWWGQAFSAAGYRDAFRVEMLPPDADPLDARYNVINWVHRATRGWSYGSSLTDPRTGEIIKGHVLLGSLRVRQDYLLMEGLLAPYDSTGDRPPDQDPMLRAALARIRQLSAHEVGHTLGLAHNYAASINNRASVMDYPAPLVLISRDGTPAIGSAYAIGIGEWDKVAIRYGYSEIPDSVDEHVALSAILVEAEARGLSYLTDQDARPAGSAHPLAHLWDNGTDAVRGLRDAMAVRRATLARFGPDVIRNGRPLATMHEVLVPLYLHHRYQIEAASKLVGGQRYEYQLKGQTVGRPLPATRREQEEALSVLLSALEAPELAVPVAARTQIPPRPPGFDATRELFDGYSDPAFDAYAPAEVVASLVVDLLLNSERIARLMYQADFDSRLPSLSDMLADVSEAVWEADLRRDDYEAELQRIVQQVWVDGLVAAVVRPGIAPGVRARLRQHLIELQDFLGAEPGEDHETVAHRALIFDQLDRFLVRLYDPEERTERATTPPGSPIGSGGEAVLRMNTRREWLEAWQPEPGYCSMDG